jgi:glycosyltransferase involved in cell wall biosynthesis
MKCWIASFPRSGNTFFRNILYYVYGIESSTWHKETAYPVDENYAGFDFVKTHLLPSELEPNDEKIPAIYLIRDGRDALVSIAHHRSDIVEPGSDFKNNLKEAIFADEGSYFGGWSNNANQWAKRADLIIKYEDLISNPKKVFERVEKLISLPQGNWENLPDFKSMKYGKPKYGGQTTSKIIKIEDAEFAEKFFRKGVSGSWKSEMPEDLLNFFWQFHGETMESMGYDESPSKTPQNSLIDKLEMKKLGLLSEDISVEKKKIKVLIEANKLLDTKNDGIKVYLSQLLRNFEILEQKGSSQFSFDLLIDNKIIPIINYFETINSLKITKKNYEIYLLSLKKLIKNNLPKTIYNPLADIYRNSPARDFLRKTKKSTLIKEEKKILQHHSKISADYDVVHLPLPQNYEKIKHFNSKVVVTIHDITHKLFPQYHTKLNVNQSEEGVGFCKEKADSFIAISKNTSQDLKQTYNIPENKIDVIYEASDPNLFYQNFNSNHLEHVRNKYQISNHPYFLCLSTIEPRKNITNTIKGFKIFREKHPTSNVNLVIAGEKGWKVDKILSENFKDSQNIIFTGYIEDIDLKVIYSDAIAFCYLSYYEGFGLPPLEAMSCKTPVIHSGVSSLSEVIGDCGHVADPDNPQSIGEKMEFLFLNPTQRESLANKGFEKSLTYSWRKTTFETLKVYKKCVH